MSTMLSYFIRKNIFIEINAEFAERNLYLLFLNPH